MRAPGNFFYNLLRRTAAVVFCVAVAATVASAQENAGAGAAPSVETPPEETPIERLARLAETGLTLRDRPLQRVSEQELLEALVTDEGLVAPPLETFVTPAEIREIYEASGDRFTEPAAVRASLLTFDTRIHGFDNSVQRAIDVRKRIESGTAVGEIAAGVCDQSSATDARGRLAGGAWLVDSDIQPILAEKLQGLAVGESCSPFELGSMIALLVLDERREARKANLEDVTPLIEEGILEARRQQRLAAMKEMLVQHSIEQAANPDGGLRLSLIAIAEPGLNEIDLVRRVVSEVYPANWQEKGFIASIRNGTLYVRATGHFIEKTKELVDRTIAELKAAEFIPGGR